MELEPTKHKRNAALIRRYRDGETLREIGLAFGISHIRVRQIVNRDAPGIMRTRGYPSHKAVR